MSTTFVSKVRVQEFLEEDPAFIRLIYQYLGWAAFWLLVGTGAGLLVSIKFSYPDFLPYSWLSFGRLRMVHTNTVFWGWTSPAMVGLCLYVVARTSRVRLYSFTLPRIAPCTPRCRFLPVAVLMVAVPAVAVVWQPATAMARPAGR